MDITLLEEVKLFLRVDGDDTDPIILELVKTAKEYIKSTTGREYQDNQINKLCVKLLVMHWFDGESKDIPHGIQSMLTHIEYR